MNSTKTSRASTTWLIVVLVFASSLRHIDANTSALLTASSMHPSMLITETIIDQGLQYDEDFRSDVNNTRSWHGRSCEKSSYIGVYVYGRRNNL
ncbi:hypothetical protein BRARA_I00306 [Brassica rapa]|uniref:Uncharacterized protein n=1 Tax=Brassica campestris TaxID=3711 RepID=A0A397XVJ7_BRACM|nr:hypothetical protein BRARA_I00306 [Brassica rapa]